MSSCFQKLMVTQEHKLRLQMNGVSGEPIWQMQCLICGGEIGEALNNYDIIYYHFYNLNFELFMYGLPMPNKYILYEPFI
jgi:hypothetical protein